MTQLDKFRNAVQYKDTILRGIALNPKAGTARGNAKEVLSERGVTLESVVEKDYSTLDEGQLENIISMEHSREATKAAAQTELDSRN